MKCFGGESVFDVSAETFLRWCGLRFDTVRGGWCLQGSRGKKPSDDAHAAFALKSGVLSGRFSTLLVNGGTARHKKEYGGGIGFVPPNVLEASAGVEAVECVRHGSSYGFDSSMVHRVF